MDEMIKFEQNSDSKYYSMSMSDNICYDNIETVLEDNNTLNKKVKKLYYGKEYTTQTDINMKEYKKEDNSNSSSTFGDIDSFQYSGELDLMGQESLSNDGDIDSNQVPYRSRCNTWPRLQPQQETSENYGPSSIYPNTDDIKIESDPLTSTDGNDGSSSKNNEGQLRKLLNKASNCSTETSNVSTSLLYGCLQGHSTFQQPHLSYPNRRPFSPSVESPLTNRISGSYMLSHQSAQPISCAGGMDRVNVSGNAPPMVRSPSVSNQDESLLNSFPTSSLHSGPLPLLSEEDMVLDSEFMNFSKDCGSNEPEKLQNDVNNQTTIDKGNDSNELSETNGTFDIQTKPGSNADGELMVNKDMLSSNQSVERKEQPLSHQTLNKSSSISPSSVNHSSSTSFSSSAGSCGTNVSRRNAWGNLSYADLITQAIKSSPDQRLTLSQIYDWLITNITHFREKSDNVSSLGWKVIALFNINSSHKNVSKYNI